MSQSNVIPLRTVPDFFIAGAPKCGTTSLYEHLRSHPDVFMPHDQDNFWTRKEPSYFSRDLDISPSISIKNADEYFSLFSAGMGKRRIGEASALYLRSECAAEEIYQCNPQARIIFTLRNPVDFMYAWYIDCVRYRHEDVMSFGQALELEQDRECGMQIPPATGYPRCLAYKKMARFSEQIERYYKVFPRGQILVLLLEDLRDNPRSTFGGICEFLDIDSGALQNVSDIHHASPRRLRTTLRAERRALAQLNRVPGMWRISNPVRDFVRPIGAVANQFLPNIADSFTPRLRASLIEEFREEVLKLSSLVERDLHHWQA